MSCGLPRFAQKSSSVTGFSSFTFSSLAQYRHGSASKITLRDREKPLRGFSLAVFRHFLPVLPS
jgi:hypothetical protein